MMIISLLSFHVPCVIYARYSTPLRSCNGVGGEREMYLRVSTQQDIRPVAACAKLSTKVLRPMWKVLMELWHVSYLQLSSE